jgi:DNA-binding transcriptional MerR regulator
VEDGEQGVLFGAESGSLAPDLGYRGPTACAAAGITYRQLDYWARTGLVEPTIRGAAGSGTQRLYSFRDVLVLRVVKRLLDAGVSLQNIRAAVATLRQRGAADLSNITLLSDGASVYELTSPDEVVDLLQGGQAVFAIALGSVVRDVEGSLATLPAERADDGDAEPATEATSDAAVDTLDAGTTSADELATRRRRRNTG